MKKIFMFGIITFLVFGGLFLVNDFKDKNNINQMKGTINNTLFQGPVPEGYDLEYFRKTGKTKLLEDVKE